MVWRNYWDALLELVFPGSHLCYFCWRKIGEQKVRGVCDSCCAKILQLGRARSVGPLDKVVSIVPYEGIYREMIAELKYSGRAELVKPLGYLIARKIKAAGLARKSSVLIPVPLHPVREAERGFNQSSLLAREIAGQLGLCCEEAILKRVHYNANQARLGKRERICNIKGAFAVERTQSDKIAGKSVILIDDIITTGATLTACAEALQSCKAGSIIAFTWAAGVPSEKQVLQSKIIFE